MKLSEERGSEITTSNHRRRLTSLKDPLPWELVPGLKVLKSLADVLN